ncbi:MFS transporter [Vandammella animalimorsus]|nr:MFS transporter [Vandammella animalimorsus]
MSIPPASPAPPQAPTTTTAAPGAAQQPALSGLEWALLVCVYLSQYMAYGFFFVSLMVILRERGVPLAHMGWLYSLGLFTGLKFLWAPLMDRWGFGRHGHYSVWLALMQALLIAALLWLAALPMNAPAALPLGALAAGSVLVAFLTACQDMAADGLSCRLLGPGQRGLGNAVQMAGGMLGFAAGGGGVLLLYESLGWRWAVLSLTALNLLTLALALAYREPPHARPDPVQGRQRMRSHWRQLLAFWRQPHTGWPWAAFLALLQAGVCMAYGVLTPMLVDAGWSAGKIGRVINIYASVASVAVMLALGWLMRRTSPARALRWMLPAQVLAVALLAAPLLLRAGDVWVMLGVIGYLALYMPLGALAAALMMGQASVHAPATDFSMQYGLYTCAGFAASGLALPLAGRMGYAGLLALAAGVGALMCLLIPWLWRRSQSLTLEPAKS